jgi:uncharacterized protein
MRRSIEAYAANRYNLNMLETVQQNVIGRVQDDLQTVYGHRLDRLMLFGSRARGDARSDSDYDVAVFLTDMTDRLAEIYRLADMRVGWFYATGAMVDAKPYLASQYFEQSPIMSEIRIDGVLL